MTFNAPHPPTRVARGHVLKITHVHEALTLTATVSLADDAIFLLRTADVPEVLLGANQNSSKIFLMWMVLIVNSTHPGLDLLYQYLVSKSFTAQIIR
jgi:hypothetical protein